MKQALSAVLRPAASPLYINQQVLRPAAWATGPPALPEEKGAAAPSPSSKLPCKKRVRNVIELFWLTFKYVCIPCSNYLIKQVCEFDRNVHCL